VPEHPLRTQGAGQSKPRSPPVEKPSTVMTTSSEPAPKDECIVSDIICNDIDGPYADGPSSPQESNFIPGLTLEPQSEPLCAAEEFKFELNTSILPSGPSVKQTNTTEAPLVKLQPTATTVPVNPSLSHNVSTLVNISNLISLSHTNLMLIFFPQRTPNERSSVSAGVERPKSERSQISHEDGGRVSWW
jgi:hypothetical protein